MACFRSSKLPEVFDFDRYSVLVNREVRPVLLTEEVDAAKGGVLSTWDKIWPLMRSALALTEDMNASSNSRSDLPVRGEADQFAARGSRLTISA